MNIYSQRMDKMKIVLYLLFSLTQASAFWTPKTKNFQRSQNGNVGYPSFVTDYILQDKLEEGRNNCTVIGIKGNIKSYSGYFTISAKIRDFIVESNMFFWYFPAENKPENAPVILWLQGGPGASSLIGLFQEIGPFMVKNKGLKMRKYYWSKPFHLLFLDNPIGTGFSYTNREEGYAKNEEDVAKDLYAVLLQFFILFPNLQKNNFFISGESYAGKYVPVLANKIDLENSSPKSKKLKINLKGITIGNGFCDPENMMVYSDYLYQIGLIDDEGKYEFSSKEKEITNLIKRNDFQGAYQKFNTMLNGDGETQKTLFFNLTHSENYFDYRTFKDDGSVDNLVKYLESDVARRLIHVGDKAFHIENLKVEQYMREDFMKSAKRYIESLLTKYKVLIYNGQFDIIVGYPITANFIKTLQWNGAAQFKSTPRKPLIFENEVAGYYKTAKNLYQVLVRNAGHMVPKDQPYNALTLIDRFVFGKPLSD